MRWTDTRGLERRWGDWARARLPVGVADLVLFCLKMGWAALFGLLLIVAILATRVIWSPDWPLARYDALVIFALAVQALFLAVKLETWREAKVILIFHLTGTAMEIFKVNAGSWAYPEPGLVKLWGVPLFSGFMYASVGSFMARVIRIFDMRFAPYPPFGASLALALAIYVNFFSHHFLPDIRIALFAATVILFWHTRITYRVRRVHWMPMVLAAVLSSFFLWVAENIGTNTGTWVYAGQGAWELVSLSKMGSWYLLLYVSFVSVTLVYRDALEERPLRSTLASPSQPERSP
ncbi:MAG: DUF817 domain-containing protein [Pseudomonadota bacterium]|nr:DUF817 domain-containing protein [Pseudomonadota bacterium]